MAFKGVKIGPPYFDVATPSHPSHPKRLARLPCARRPDGSRVTDSPNRTMGPLVLFSVPEVLAAKDQVSLLSPLLVQSECSYVPCWEGRISAANIQKEAQVISPTACGALFSDRTTPQSSWNPGGSLVEAWWNPGGTLVEPYLRAAPDHPEAYLG